MRKSKSINSKVRKENYAKDTKEELTQTLCAVAEAKAESYKPACRQVGNTEDQRETKAPLGGPDSYRDGGEKPWRC
jgi:hypothetical protein